MKLQCTLEFSPSGKLCWIRLLGSKESLAEFLVHGPFAEVCAALDGNGARVSVLPKVFRAEVFGLAGYEFLNKTDERIEEK